MDPTNKVTESSLWNVDQNGVPDNAAKVKKGIEFVVKFFSTNPDE